MKNNIRATRKQILAGETTAGPLAIWYHQNPTRFWVASVLATFVLALLFGWLLVV